MDLRPTLRARECDILSVSMKNANVFAGFVSNIEEYCIEMDTVNSFGAYQSSNHVR